MCRVEIAANTKYVTQPTTSVHLQVYVLFEKWLLILIILILHAH